MSLRGTSRVTHKPGLVFWEQGEGTEGGWEGTGWGTSKDVAVSLSTGTTVFPNETLTTTSLLLPHTHRNGRGAEGVGPPILRKGLVITVSWSLDKRVNLHHPTPVTGNVFGSLRREDHKRDGVRTRMDENRRVTEGHEIPST